MGFLPVSGLASKVGATYLNPRAPEFKLDFMTTLHRKGEQSLLLLAGSIPGVWIGAHFSARTPEVILRNTIAAVLAVVGLKMLG